MDMTKEALQYVNDLKAPAITEIGGETYSDKELHRISYNPKAAVIEMSTLNSLVEYIKSDQDFKLVHMYVHVESPTVVRLFSSLDDERKREVLVKVTAPVPRFDFNEYMDHESFLIALQSMFLPGEDRDLILKFTGTVESGTVAQYGDDGISQKATIKKGIAGKEDALIPNPVKLRPYRTFVEVEQPESSFIFRMKDDRRLECAIFEADGGAWKNFSMNNIKEYLQSELAEYPQFTVIS